MAGDQYWYNKVLGLHCDGTNGSTTFTDVKSKTVTAYGNAQISTAQYPSLTGKSSSAYFDGTSWASAHVIARVAESAYRVERSGSIVRRATAASAAAEAYM